MQLSGDETLEELETKHKNTIDKIEQIFSTLLFGHSNPDSLLLKLRVCFCFCFVFAVTNSTSCTGVDS